jgi:hypothetical protein
VTAPAGTVEAGVVAGAIAERLAVPASVPGLAAEPDWWRQSLAHGALGVALLHIERAHAGLGPWQRAHEWIRYATCGEVMSGLGSHLYQGVPALAFALHAAAADQPGRYARALGELDRHIAVTIRHRLDHAHARIDRRGLPALAEFDTIRGLAGVGAYLLRRDPSSDLIRAVLAYLVRLTEPITDDGDLLPGWWTSLDPAGRPAPAAFPGGHANNGMAHGIGGPLALLSLAQLHGATVDGQAAAIGRIRDWLDWCRRHGPGGVWWPYWVTRAELRGQQIRRAGPGRPSWCYGTAGLARAQQLAALATGDTARCQTAEHALVRALSEPGQLDATTDSTLCHGYAGLLHIAARAAADTPAPNLAERVPHLLAALLSEQTGTSRADAPPLAADATSGIGLLVGAAGVALALHTHHTGTAPVSGWDSCLLIA